jgi:hypothetical protein
MKEIKIVLIEWIDSTYYKCDYICEGEDIPIVEPKTLYSAGIFIGETDSCVAICQDVIEEGMGRMVLSIPKISIKKMKVIKQKF